jgi:superoxide dismutase, Cu-Zn family
MRFRNLALLMAVGVSAACATMLYDPTEWTANVQPRAGTDVRANFSASSVTGVTSAAINMIGGTAGATHPWHIHDGTCATGGPIVGDAAAYPPLRPNSAGAATAQARVRIQLVAGRNYHVNIHRSPQALNEIIGCGDLR